MISRDPLARMWAEACQMLDEAERLHRQFFRLDFPRGARAAWQPPVDVFEDENGFVIVAALPGVAPDSAEVVIEGQTLVIRAERRALLEDGDTTIHRLEIPHGYFERRLDLPDTPIEVGAREWRDGCLVLAVRKLRKP